MKLYSENAASIQGSNPEAGEVKRDWSNAKTSVYTLSIFDGNDEGERWEVIYNVTMANESPFVLQISESIP